jgi:hypothetical protein
VHETSHAGRSDIEYKLATRMDRGLHHHRRRRCRRGAPKEPQLSARLDVPTVPPHEPRGARSVTHSGETLIHHLEAHSHVHHRERTASLPPGKVNCTPRFALHVPPRCTPNFALQRAGMSRHAGPRGSCFSRLPRPAMPGAWYRVSRRPTERDPRRQASSFVLVADTRSPTRRFTLGGAARSAPKDMCSLARRGSRRTSVRASSGGRR